MNMLDGIVRIASNKRIGTGFVVSDDGLIATCAHVLGPFRPATAGVIFQATGEERVADVIAEGWRTVDAEDVAVLRVIGAVPRGVQPLPLGSSHRTEGHPLVAFGYPETGEVEGVRAMGTILGRGARTRGGQPLLQLRSSEITEGFSGAPVWDELRQRVVGMVVIAAERDELGKLGETAFATPTETLRAVYPTLQVSDLCPYRSLEAFTEEDAAFFFGRGWIIDELVESLKKEQRFLAVFGSSGCGKSSLVQAGLIPRLRAGAIPRSDRWAILVTRPTNPTFQDILTGLNQHSPPTAVIVDPFEELFTSVSDAARTEAVIELTRLLENTPSITLVIVMRNDFYNRFVQHESLVPWLSRGLVNISPNVRRYELITMAKEPVALVGMDFEGGLAEAMVTDALATPFMESRDTGSSAVLPLLEFALTQLWERHQDGILTHQAYQQIGGVTGSLTQWANQAYYRFEEQQRPLVHYLFTALVHLGDEAQHIPDTRRRRVLTSLVRNEEERAEVFEVVQRLVAARLLVMSQDIESKQETIEIIHDALLWEWGLLKQWVEEDRRFLSWHQELGRRARAWIDTSTDDPTKRDVYKLFGGSDLTEALDWMKMRAQKLSQSEHEFIQASQKQQKKIITRRRFIGIVILGVTGGGFALGRLLLPPMPSLPQSHPSPPFILSGHTDAVTSVAWSPSGQWVATSDSRDNSVHLWDIITGRPGPTFREHTDYITQIAWSSNSQWLAIASRDKTALIADAATGESLYLFRGHQNVINTIAWSPSGQWVATSSDDHTARLWEPFPDPLLRYTDHTGPVSGVTWSPSGQWVATYSGDNTAQIWDAVSGQTLHIFNGHQHTFTNIVWSPSGQWLAASSEDGTAQIWDAVSGQTLHILNSHQATMDNITWSPSGQWIATYSSDGNLNSTAYIWDAASGRLLHVLNDHPPFTTAIAWSPNGHWLATSSEPGTARIWDASSGQLLHILSGHRSFVFSVAWSPNGQWLASGSADSTARIWNASTGEPIFILRGHTEIIRCIAWSPNGQRLATSSDDGTARIWDVLSGQTLYILKSPMASVKSVNGVMNVAWSPNGQWLASSHRDGTAWIWNTSTGRPFHVLRGHTNTVNNVVWSPTGQRLATSSADSTACIWFFAGSGKGS